MNIVDCIERWGYPSYDYVLADAEAEEQRDAYEQADMLYSDTYNSIEYDEELTDEQCETLLYMMQDITDIYEYSSMEEIQEYKNKIENVIYAYEQIKKAG